MVQQHKRRFNRSKGLNKREKKQVNAIINKRSELKEKVGSTADTTYSATTAAGSLLSLSTSQGDGSVDERVGDEMLMKDLAINVAVKQVSNSGIHRLYMYQYLEDANPSGLANLQPNNFWPNIQTSTKKYKVLFDRSFALDVDAGRSHKLVKIRIPAKQLAIKKISFAAGSSTIESGAVACFLSTDNTTSNNQSVDADYRVRYYDA